MSTWTHVSATVRYDAIRRAGIGGLPDLGKTFTYEDSQEKWEACTVPRGSEGSLQYLVWDNPSKNDLSAFTVVWWGDLRDYDDEVEIVKYFNRVTKKQMVRSGILLIEVEGREPLVYVFDQEKCRWSLVNGKGRKAK